MEEFNTLEKVQELFASIDAIGDSNLFFVACQDKQKVSEWQQEWNIHMMDY